VCPLVRANRAERTVPAQTIIVEDPELKASLSPEAREEFEAFMVVQSRRVWKRTRDEVNVGLSVADVPFLEKLQGQGYAFSLDADASYPAFEKPALLLMGRQDAVVGYRDAWELVEKFPRGTFAVLDRAGHNIQIEQEGLFNCLVAEWLDRVEENLAQAPGT
jgi:pimeloyl-ACP methyl ester carboxylesterase